MELKETRKLATSIETNVQPRPERNDSNNHKVFDLLYPEIKDSAVPTVDEDGFQEYHEKPLFRSVSTLDWLTTWRPLEIS
tara:strand:+ start:160 stop:399 length:240 start_codon:yes stop_codon:yes gene_type:complete